MFKFITGKPLWVNILAGIILAVLVIVLFLQSLDWLTKHGKTLTIPAVTGKSYTEAVKTLESEGFEVELQDSVYNDTAAPLSVIRQFPDADAVVKRNRTVYLTINRAVPPMIEMPGLEGLSYRSAEVSLKQYGLRLEDTLYRSDWAKNNVLEQRVNGERIKPGTKIPMGSSIVLVLGSGLGQEVFNVPDLFGKTLSEAQIFLESYGLSMGTVLPEELSNDPNAYVASQRPEHLTADGRVNRIRQGQLVDLFLQRDKPVRQLDSVPQAGGGNEYFDE